MRFVWILCVAAATYAQTPESRDWRTWFNTGAQEFKSARYALAAAAFQKAVDLKPDEVTPRLYLGTAWMQQYIPGDESPENLTRALIAEDQFQHVLGLEPQNRVAVARLASLSLDEKKWEEAQTWYEKVIAADPRNRDAYYSLGFIAWSRWYPEYGKARAAAGMRQETPSPIPNPNVRADLLIRFGGVIESGLANLQKALEIDPNYSDAMAYLNLLIRERADLRDSKEEYARDIASADEWVKKAIEAKRAKAHPVW